MSCIFCEIAAGRAPADIVYQDEQVIAFRDQRPQAPVHILVIPRAHLSGPQALDGEHEALAGRLISAAGAVAQQEGLADAGYRLVLNQGRDGGQSVSHVHLHLLGGRRMGWPPG